MPRNRNDSRGRPKDRQPKEPAANQKYPTGLGDFVYSGTFDGSNVVYGSLEGSSGGVVHSGVIDSIVNQSRAEKTVQGKGNGTAKVNVGSDAKQNTQRQVKRADDGRRYFIVDLYGDLDAGDIEYGWGHNEKGEILFLYSKELPENLEMEKGDIFEYNIRTTRPFMELYEDDEDEEEGKEDEDDKDEEDDKPKRRVKYDVSGKMVRVPIDVRKVEDGSIAAENFGGTYTRTQVYDILGYKREQREELIGKARRDGRLEMDYDMPHKAELNISPDSTITQGVGVTSGASVNSGNAANTSSGSGTGQNPAEKEHPAPTPTPARYTGTVTWVNYEDDMGKIMVKKADGTFDFVHVNGIKSCIGLKRNSTVSFELLKNKATNIKIE